MQVKADTPFDSRVTTPIGQGAESRRAGWMFALIAVLGVAVLALGAALVYPAVTTTDGEAVMNGLDDAWNSGEVTAFPDIYASNAVIVVGTARGSATAETIKGLDAIEASASDMQAQGFHIERTGPVTESPSLIAYPATITTDTETTDLMVILRYDDSGMILEHYAIWQTP
jgi:hypothetical protein